MTGLGDAVMAYAQENWGVDGWDFIYECWTIAEIEQELDDNNVTTREAAVTFFAEIALLSKEADQDRAEMWAF